MRNRSLVRIGVCLAGSMILAGLPTGTAVAAPDADADIITCKLSLDYPHASGHVAGTISAQGRVSCTKTMTEIYVKTSLENVASKTWASQTFDRFNVSAGDPVGAKSCLEGPATFRSHAASVVHFPPGYSPSSGVMNHSSPNTWVACGVPSPVFDPPKIEDTITAVKE